MFQNETRHMSKMKDPVAGNELAHHFYSVHGGWYEDGPAFQIVKAVQLVGRRRRRSWYVSTYSYSKDEGPTASQDLEAERKKMITQLGLFSPNGLNLR